MKGRRANGTRNKLTLLKDLLLKMLDNKSKIFKLERVVQRCPFLNFPLLKKVFYYRVNSFNGQANLSLDLL